MTTQTDSTEISDRTLHITRVFNAPRDVVFAAWSKPEHIGQWCAPRGFTIPYSEGEIHPGGAWKSCMRSPDGTEYRLGGVYQEIEPNTLISFTHAWDEDGHPGHETLVTVQFLDEPSEKTKLVFKQSVFASEESRNNHEGGWNQCLDRLDDYLKTIQN